MIPFTIRNLKIFFRDKAAVFFSLLASFIIIGLYVLFLGDVWTSNLGQMEHARQVMDHWVMAGLLAATSVTTTMGAFGIMVIDRTKKIDKDLYSSPVSRQKIAGGYVLSAFIIGFILSVITLVLAELYIVMEGGSWMSLPTLFKVLGLILLADFANTSMVFFLTSFFSSETAFSTASTILGTLIGFVTGIYLPLGMLPGAVQWIVKLFPPSHAAVLLRQVMMADPLALSFAGAPAESLEGFKEMFGIFFQFGDTVMGTWGHIAVLVATGLFFFVMTVLNLSRKKK